MLSSTVLVKICYQSQRAGVWEVSKATCRFSDSLEGLTELIKPIILMVWFSTVKG